MSTLIRAANLAGIEELMAELGHDAAPLLARYHIHPQLIRDPEAYVPYRSLAAVIEQAALDTRCPDFGLRISHWQGLDMLGPIAVIARAADNVLHAFEGIAHYLHIHGPALKLSLQGRTLAGDYGFRFRIEERGLSQLTQSYELSMANASSILRLLTANKAKPARIYFTHAPLSNEAVYQRAFACPVEFNTDSSGFDLSEADALRPLSSADAQTLHVAQSFLESHGPSDAQLSEQVNELIHRLLPTGQCRIQTVAEQLAMHPRTLQRHLRQDGTCFETLLDGIRRDKARTYLAISGMRFSQISGLLGYADQSTFNRACRRWYRLTPKSLRHHLLRKTTLMSSGTTPGR